MSAVEDQNARLARWLSDIQRRQGDGQRLPDGRLGAISDHMIGKCNKVHLSYHKRIELFFDWARRRLDAARSSEWDRDDLLQFADALIEYGQHVLPEVDEEVREKLEDLERFRSHPCTVSAHPPFPFPEDATLQYIAPAGRKCPCRGQTEHVTPEPQVSEDGLDCPRGAAHPSSPTIVLAALTGQQNDELSVVGAKSLEKGQANVEIGDNQGEQKDEFSDKLGGSFSSSSSFDPDGDGYEGSDESSCTEDAARGGEGGHDAVGDACHDANKDDDSADGEGGNILIQPALSTYLLRGNAFVKRARTVRLVLVNLHAD